MTTPLNEIQNTTFYYVEKLNEILDKNRGEGFEKYYVTLHGGGRVKNCQNRPYVINEWPLNKFSAILLKIMFHEDIKILKAASSKYLLKDVAGQNDPIYKLIPSSVI